MTEKAVSECIHCKQEVYDHWHMGDMLGWVLVEGAQYEGDDHCAVSPHSHHEVAADHAT